MIRKILSKSEQEKKRKRNSIIIGVILMIVMFGSVFGVVVGSFGKNSSGKNKMEILYVYKKKKNEKIKIKKNLQQIASRIQPACISKEDCSGDFPIKTCSDNFIIIKNGTEEITQVENCVYIKGEKQELSKLTDSFLYKILGVK